MASFFRSCISDFCIRQRHISYQRIVCSVQSLHELFAELTVISSLVAAAFKIYLKMEGKETGLLKWIVFAVYGLTAVLVIITGHFGGILVYRHLIPAVY